MTDPFPDVCACGCGRPPAGSYWYSDLCLWTWLAKVNDPLKLDEPVRTFCGSTYTEQPASEPVVVEVEEMGSDWDGPDMRQSGVDTPGCDCGHEGMAAGWHLDSCAWRRLVEAEAEYLRPCRELAEACEEFAGAVKEQMFPPLERTVGWLSRWLDRLEKGNQQ